MNRRLLIKNTLGLGFGFLPVGNAISESNRYGSPAPGPVGPRRPLHVYNNWASYDELSDNIPLTESLALKELNELIRLKKSGVKVDYYMMDAFWFDKAGGFRTWRKERWPNGPDQWLQTCIENKITPGMWFPVNDRIPNGDDFFLDLIPEWKDSATTTPKALCLFRGGYLKHLFETLQIWFDKGVKMFKFDFARFFAASEETQRLYLQSEIEAMNKMAFFDALKQFREKNPEVMFTGYNGFGGEMANTYHPFRKNVDLKWLEVFDTLYCGDPRFSDVPTINVWRSQDIYSDHMVMEYAMNGLPINRIDNCGFMIGVAGTCYKRATSAWMGMLILELARGGWMNIYHGNLELLNEKDAGWFARTQSLYHELQEVGLVSTFGGTPGKRQAYGFMAKGKKGTVCTVVNPTQGFTDVKMPVDNFTKSTQLYADGGFRPVLKGNSIRLGPEQMAVVGFDEYADQKYQLGTDRSINIPIDIEPVACKFADAGRNVITTTIQPPKGKDIRILVQQFGADDFPKRVSGGHPPNGTTMDKFISIVVTQEGKPVPLQIEYDKMIWSGLSWAAGEIKSNAFDNSRPLEIRCLSTDADKLTLKAEIYSVSYQ